MAKCEGCGAEGELKACEVKDKAEDTAHDAYWKERAEKDRLRSLKEAERHRNAYNRFFW